MSKPDWARIPKVHEHYSVYGHCHVIMTLTLQTQRAENVFHVNI